MGPARARLRLLGLGLPLVLLATLAALVLSPSTRHVHAQDVRAVLDTAEQALGGSVATLQVSGRGSDYVVGQQYDGASPWPRFELRSVSMAFDYRAPAMRFERVRAQAEDVSRGGGAFQPLVGEQRLVQLVSGKYAWNMSGERVSSAGGAGAFRGESPGLVLTTSPVDERLLYIYLTPHGFLSAARAAAKPTLRTETIRGNLRTVISFIAVPLNLRMEGVLNDRHLLERIETWVDHPVLGDTMIEAALLDYRSYDGLMFPGKLVIRQGGYPVFELVASDVRSNATVPSEVPDDIRAEADAAPLAPSTPAPTEVSPGVWFFGGGGQAVAVEFRDHVIVVDAPVNEARSIGVIAGVRKVIPGKPIRYVINTHIHFDHAAGLRAYAAEGTTIVTEMNNVPYYEQAWSNPRTIKPDRLAKSGRRAVIEGVVGSRLFSDGVRKLAVYHYGGNAHNSGMLMAFLPRERILIQADSYLPGPRAGGHPAMPNLRHFAQSLDRLQLDVEQILPMHGSIATMEDLRKTLAE